MDFTLTDDQRDLKDAARRLFAERLPPERLRELADAADARDAVDAKLWAEVIGLGWVGITSDLGGDFTLEAVLIEEAGYALAPIPLLSTSIAVPGAVGLGGASGRGAATVAWAEPAGALAFGPAEHVRLAAVEQDGADRLIGHKVDVPDMQLAQTLVVLVRADVAGSTAPALCVVDRAKADETRSVQVTYQPTLDGTRRVARVDFVSTPSQVTRASDDTIAAVRRRAFAGLAVESVGVAQRALDLAVAHASSREQFGRVIGSFQAVAHRIADVYVAVELARTLAYRAAWWVATTEHRTPENRRGVNGRTVTDSDVDTACAAAKAAAGDAAVQASETLIQVLGGMGMTWEHPAHRFYRRALANRSYAGTPGAHRATIAAALLDV